MLRNYKYILVVTFLRVIKYWKKIAVKVHERNMFPAVVKAPTLEGAADNGS